MAETAKAGCSPAAEAIAEAVMREFGPRTADEAQEALRQVFGPMIESVPGARPEAHLGYPSNDKGPKATPDRLVPHRLGQ